MTIGARLLIKGMEVEPVPPVNVVFYQEGDKVEMQQWLRGRPKDEADQCVDRLMSLQEHGYELEFPACEHLEDKIYQLRARKNKVRLRTLYFFHERVAAVVTHGFQKTTKKTPPAEIEKAKKKRERYQKDPESHTFNWEPDND
ncbi:MAG: type II toxin-antitoxin system RelE/ParE family toxin [Pseudomonadota bacterium]